MITIDHVSYRYPDAAHPAVDDLTLTIAPGEFLVVCGPSGSGKSTVLRLLNGLVPHFHGGVFAGDVRVWGRSTKDHQPRDLANLVGFVFQDPEAQFVVDHVEDEIAFAMENLGLPHRLMRRRAEEVLDQLGIAHLRRRRVSSLSGGEQQRVAIAAVLAAQPRALVLDEPTSQIDPHGAEEVLTALQKLNDDLGLTVVLAEHRLERVVQYADRLLYLGPDAEGRVGALVGPPRQVLSEVALAPPLARLGRALGWSPLPLTIKEGRRFAADRSAADGQRPAAAVAPPLAVRHIELRHGQAAGATSPAPRKQLGLMSTAGRQPDPAQPAVAVSRLHVAYGDVEALYDLSLAAWPGQVLAVMGRNGSGKSTLFRAIVGLLRPQRGAVALLGHDVTQQPVERRAGLVAYVPQNPRALLFHDTLEQELAATLRACGRDAGPAAVAGPLELLGLAHLALAYPRDLSGGEAQRAALAAMLAGERPVLLLDEPTRGLDYLSKAQLGALLRRLAGRGAAILVATHDVELVAAYADRVALLGDGELVVEGPVREVLADSLIFSSQIAKLFPGSGWVTVEDVLGAAS